MSSKKLSRRAFLFASSAGVAGLVLAACSNEAPTAVSGDEAVATNTPLPGEVDVTTIPTQAATNTPIPTVATTKYNEAPALAELVKAGKLPPVEERLPKNPLVLSPVNTIGKYGGRIRTYSDWLGGQWAECQYGFSPLRWIDDGQAIAPGLLDKWSSNEDASVWTLHMREGLKWSDGEPCTVDDILFWWNDLTQAFDPANIDGIPDYGHDANGALVKFTKVDDYTLTLSYGTSAPLTAKQLAMWVNGIIGSRWIAPTHYLKQFHPKYNTEMKDTKTLADKIWWPSNPECPVLTSWKPTTYEASKMIKWDRNPYYYAVDTQGNQLPYIDGLDEEEVLDKQVKLLKIMQGDIDFNNFAGMALSDVSTLKQNEAKGDYKVVLLDCGSGTGQLYYWNHDNPDEKLRNLYRNDDFRRAMSFSLDRPTIQSAVYYGEGIITTGTFSPKAFEFNFNAEAKAYYKKAREMYAAYDPDKAKTLLDGIGCKVGADGWRTYPDGSPLEVRIDLQADAGTECMNVLEIAKKNWEDVGLKIVVNTMTGTTLDPMWYAGKGSIHTNWEWADGPDFLVYPDPGTPVTHERWAPLCGLLYQYAGTPQENSEADKSPWDRQPPRFNKNDPEYKGTIYEQLHKIYRQAIIEPDEMKRAKLSYDLWNIHLEHGPMFLGTVANTPVPIIVGNKMENVPTKEQYKLGGWVNPWILPNCAMTNPETYSFK